MIDQINGGFEKLITLLVRSKRASAVAWFTVVILEFLLTLEYQRALLVATVFLAGLYIAQQIVNRVKQISELMPLFMLVTIVALLPSDEASKFIRSAIIAPLAIGLYFGLTYLKKSSEPESK